MATNSPRNLTPAEEASIEDALQRLREHFAEWPYPRGHEQSLVEFAFYEGCGGTEHCGQLLAESTRLRLAGSW